jgi:hypothetical protein
MGLLHFSDHFYEVGLMPTEYLLPCTCGKKTTIVTSQAGQNMTCECGATLVVPKFREITQLEVAEKSVSKNSGRSTSSDSWHGGIGAIAAISLGLALVTLTFCGYYIYCRAGLDTSVTIDDELRAGNRYYDSLTSAEVILGYQEVVAYGMGVRDNPPAWHVQKLWADWYETRIIYTGAGALLLLVASGFLFWLSRRLGKPSGTAA